MAKCMKCGKPIKNNRSICSFCDGHMCGYDKGRADAFKECIDILKGIDKQVADIFENIVMNAEHYNKKGGSNAHVTPGAIVSAISHAKQRKQVSKYKKVVIEE